MATSVGSHQRPPPAATTGPADDRLRRNSYEAVTLVCTITSVLAGVIGTVVTIMAFMQSS